MCAAGCNTDISGRPQEGLGTEKEEMNVTAKLENQIIITLSREYGSGGRYIGKLVAEKLGISVDEDYASTAVETFDTIAEQ